MIFPRNRKAGSLADTDFGQTRFDPTSPPPVFLRKPARAENAIFRIRWRQLEQNR